MKIPLLMTKLNNTRGFTLLEVLIALVILSIGILGTTKLQLSFMQSNSKARVITEGTAQVQAKIEELLSLPYENLVDGNYEEIRGVYTLNWDVGTTADTKTMTMNVKWVEKGVEKQLPQPYTFMKTDLFTGAEW